jgi:hypothetical protein
MVIADSPALDMWQYRVSSKKVEINKQNNEQLLFLCWSNNISVSCHKQKVPI